jgi:L-iditol 2-dehydrogenase
LIVVDVADDRLAMAQESGATQVVNSKQEDASEIARRVTHGRGADVVYEAVGLPETVDLSVRSARKGGSVVLVGNVSPKVDLPLQVVVTRELAVFGSCASRGDYPACLDLMASRALRPESILSATAPLDRGADWFTRLYRREPGLMKVILRP